MGPSVWYNPTEIYKREQCHARCKGSTLKRNGRANRNYRLGFSLGMRVWNEVVEKKRETRVWELPLNNGTREHTSRGYLQFKS